MRLERPTVGTALFLCRIPPRGGEEVLDFGFGEGGHEGHGDVSGLGAQAVVLCHVRP